MTTTDREPTGHDDSIAKRLAAAASLYGVGADDLKQLGAFESDVYAFQGSHGPSILKVMPPGHRSVDQVLGEIDWLLALLEAGVPVSRPLKSRNDNWVESLPATGHVLAAYARAPGDIPKRSDWTVDVLERWGELLGNLQSHARDWTPPVTRRGTLAQHTYARQLDEMAETFPEFHAAAAKLVVAAAPLLGVAESRAGPHDADALSLAGRDLGLIHADLHHGNLLLHEGLLTAIDFDDCAYGSFAFDLAMPIYYAVRTQRDTPAEAVLEGFLPSFMRGFRRAARDPAGGAEAIDIALRFRQVELVMALRAKIPADSWMPELVSIEKDLRERVVNDVDFVSPSALERLLGG